MNEHNLLDIYCCDGFHGRNSSFHSLEILLLFYCIIFACAGIISNNDNGIQLASLHSSQLRRKFINIWSDFLKKGEPSKVSSVTVIKSFNIKRWTWWNDHRLRKILCNCNILLRKYDEKIVDSNRTLEPFHSFCRACHKISFWCKWINT